MESEGEWTALPARRLGQVAATEMQVGQHGGGPLPFEAVASPAEGPGALLLALALACGPGRASLKYPPPRRAGA